MSDLYNSKNLLILTVIIVLVNLIISSINLYNTKSEKETNGGKENWRTHPPPVYDPNYINRVWRISDSPTPFPTPNFPTPFTTPPIYTPTPFNPFVGKYYLLRGYDDMGNIISNSNRNDYIIFNEDLTITNNSKFLTQYSPCPTNPDAIKYEINNPIYNINMYNIKATASIYTGEDSFNSTCLLVDISNDGKSAITIYTLDTNNPYEINYDNILAMFVPYN